MADISGASLHYQRTLSAAQSSEKASAPAKTSGDIYSPERTIHDTVEISDDGTKIINLARGQELTDALPDATLDRDAFDAALEKSLEDINRITSLFGGVIDELSTLHASAPNTSSDTTQLTDDGEQVVNLGQTSEIVERLRNGSVENQDFIAYLEKSRGEIQQITTLLNETIKTAFGKS